MVSQSQIPLNTKMKLNDTMRNYGSAAVWDYNFLVLSMITRKNGKV